MTPAKQEWITRQAIGAVLRGLIIGAMKGDPKNVVTMFRLAEQTGPGSSRRLPKG
jgi:hypothetical protein